MSHGLLAKDSILDLESFGKEHEQAEAKSKQQNEVCDNADTDRPPPELAVRRGLSDVVRRKNNRNPAAERRDDGDDRNGSNTNVAANPQQAHDDDELVEQELPTHGAKRDPQHYAGFVSHADDYQLYRAEQTENYYFHDSYSHPSIRGGGATDGNTGMWKGMLPCLFPWMQRGDSNQSRLGVLSSEQLQIGVDDSSQADDSKASSSSSKGRHTDDDDAQSTTSDSFGERLSEKDRQAVLARLRLAQPDATESSTATSSAGESPPRDDDDKDARQRDERMKSDGSGSEIKKKNMKGLLQGIPTYDCSPSHHDEEKGEDGSKSTKELRSILKKKRSNSMVADSSNSNKENSMRSSSSSSSSNRDKGRQQQSHRRSLFPMYESATGNKTDHNVSFAPMARVVTVKSRNNMTGDEKGDIWWQKSDYEDFRKTGRLITKAMLAGGSEIWLASNKSWHSPDISRGQTLQNAFALSGNKNRNSGGDSDSTDDSTGDTISSEGDKWWHKFGHSRRGLEHVVSMDEGRQRQANVRNAIKCVLDETERQHMYNRQDAEKLRIVSLHHTSWARDLALASGSSDADAVQSSFSDERKSREFYLLKMARNNNTTLNTGRHVPEFMQPAMKGANGPSKTSSKLQQLDAHTAAQIRYRRNKKKSSELEEAASTSQTDASSTSSKGSSPSSSLSSVDEQTKTADSRCEPLRDANEKDKEHSESIAQRAAGFTADGDEKVDMAAVLSGMGAVSAEA